MKILFVSPTYLPSRRANTFQVMKMAQATRGLGHEVRVLVPNPGNKRIPAWRKIADHYGLTYRFDIEWLPVYERFRSYDYGLKVLRFFYDWDAHLLYTRLPQAASFASRVKIPTIFEVHDLPGGVMGPLFFRSFLSGGGARRLVLITHSLREAIERSITALPPSPFTLVTPDGVDLERYADIPGSLEARKILAGQGRVSQLPLTRFTIGYTGHLYAGRGIELILEMVAELPEASFLLVGGDPPAVERVRQEAEHRSLGNLILTGFVPNAALPVYQAACDVLLMPYQQNVAASSGGDIANYLSPMKLFEYMACKRVILSSELPVLQEVLNDQNAILLPCDDVHAWITAIRQIMDDTPRRERIAAQAWRDSKGYTWAARAEKIFSPDS